MDDDCIFMTRFSSKDRIACVLIHELTGECITRIFAAGEYEKYRPYFRFMNSKGYNVYTTTGRLKHGSRNRRKEGYEDTQDTLWCELDFPVNLNTVNLPEPSIIVRSSPGKHHFYWLLSEVMSIRETEALNRLIRNKFQMAYPARRIDYVHDISRILRVANFKNHKRNSFVGLVKFNPSLRYNPSCFHVQNGVPESHVYSGSYKSRSEEDMAEIIYRLAKRQKTPGQCIDYLIEKRKTDKDNVESYAKKTVGKAVSYVQERHRQNIKGVFP